jgi:hypothetical protein
MPLSLLFRDEEELARVDTLTQLRDEYMEHAVKRYDLNSSVDAVSNRTLEILFQGDLSAPGEGPTPTEVDDASASFDADVEAFAGTLGKHPDHLFHTFLIRRIRAANDAASDLRARAPFWYYAMCMPASFTTGASGANEIAPDAQGLMYTHATIADIRVASEREQHGEKFIEIVRAKVPHHEERVRAYRLAPADIRDLQDARLPVMPDMDAALKRNAGYEQKRVNPVPMMGAISETKSRPFGWRDSGKPDTEALDVPENYHSLWLASVLFQAFLVELARHDGVMARVPGGTCPAGTGYDPLCSEAGCVRLRGVFRYRDGIYMAPVPRPWHEERFVLATNAPASPGSAWEPGVALNEAAVHRWNDVHHNLFAIGSVLADLSGAPPMGLNFATWSSRYSTYNTDELAPLDATLLANSDLVENVVFDQNRIHFETRATVRRVQVMTRARAEALDLAALREAFNCQVRSTSIASLPGAEVEMDPLQLYGMQLEGGAGTKVVFCNVNVRSLNAWIGKEEAILTNGANVKSARRVKIHSDDVDFAVDITLKTYVTEVRYAMRAGAPDEGSERWLVPGVSAELDVARYSVQVDGAIYHFANYDGRTSDTYSPVETVLIGRPVARLYANTKLHQACNGGVMDDDSIFRVGSTDRDRRQGKGFHLNYTGPTPFVEYHNPHLTMVNSRTHPHNGAMWEWDPGARDCVVTDAARMQQFCLRYKQMDYNAANGGDCKVGWFQGILEFFTGTTLIRGLRAL